MSGWPTRRVDGGGRVYKEAMTRRALTALALALALTGVGDLPTAATVGSTPPADTRSAVQPDGRIRLLGGANVGNDIYGGARSQKVSTFVRLGATATFVVTVQNDGTAPDRLRVSARGNSDSLWVAYRSHRRDVTAQVVAGSFVTPVLAPGERHKLRVLVLPTGATTRQSRRLTVSSVTDPDVLDHVRLATSTNALTTTPSVVYRSLPTSEPVVALTFDAGSDVGFTDQILDVLADRGVQASFGITGEFARAHPTQVRRMAREGHEVMNHSDSHRSFTGTSSTEVLLSRAERQADLRAAETILTSLIGHATIPYWRPPFGDYDSSVLADVGAIGYSATVMWTIDTLGWTGLSADAILARVLTDARPGAIVAMHVGSQSDDALALTRMIDGLRTRGYRFTTVFNGLPH